MEITIPGESEDEMNDGFLFDVSIEEHQKRLDARNIDEEKTLFYDFLLTLSKQQRIIALSMKSGLKKKEISKVLKIDCDTVRIQLDRIFKKLKAV